MADSGTVLLWTISLLSITFGAAIVSIRNSRRRESEAQKRFQLLMDSVPCTISWIAQDQTYIDANRRLADLFGLKREEFVGKPVGFLSQDPRYAEFIESVFKKSGTDSTFEFVLQTSTQSRHMFCRAHTYDDGKAAAVIGVDITHLKENEKTIQGQQQLMVERSRLSYLGEMAGAIGHEINNPLAIITLSVAQMKEMAEQERMTSKFMIDSSERIERTCLRISKIIRGLKSMARDGSGDPFETSDLHTIVEETLAICRQRMVNRGVELSTSDRLSQFAAWTRPTQLIQVLSNLLNNAFEAIDNLEKRWIRIEASETPGTILISIVDAGAGIPPEVAAKIFDPFFTTKGVSQGTGIGLSLSRSIVNNLGGTLRYDPSKSNTTFTIELPKFPPRTASAT